MAFMTEKTTSLDHLKDKDSTRVDAISSQLQLKSSLSPKASSQTLDKQVVLQRIRHHKSIYRIKSAFEALRHSSEDNTDSAYEQKWLQQDDVFTSP